MKPAARSYSLKQIFAWPAAIGAVSLTALIVALLGDGVWDVAGWLGLSTVVVGIVVLALMRRFR